METTRILASLPVKQLSPDVVKSFSVYLTGSKANLSSFLLPPTYEESHASLYDNVSVCVAEEFSFYIRRWNIKL